MRRLLIGVTCLLLLACLQASAGLAAGVSGYSEPTGTLSVGIGGEATGTVPCPSGEVVLDGGYYQPLTDIFITESAPSNTNGAGWSIGVDNLTGESVSVTMYAVCAQAPPSYSIQTTSCSGSGSCTVTCPGGTSVTGGGYSYAGAITAEGSWPSATNQWALEYAFSSGSISGDAVCAQAPDGYVQESGASSQFPGLVNVPCPGGTVVLGGGGNEGTFPQQNPGWNAPIAFGPTLESGQWSFGSGYTGAPTPVSGWAICAQQQVPAPTVTGVSPSSGSVAGGTSVVITGTNLSGATAVTFGTAGPASGLTVNGATQITATSPHGTVGQVDVTVTTAGGTSAQVAGDKFTYTVAPTIGVTCTPGALQLGNSTQCAATVTNPAGSGAGVPTGSVSFGSDSAGSFGSSGKCTLSGSGGSSSCALSYSPLALGSGDHAITATYGGDSVHTAGSATTQITVTARPSTLAVVCSPNSVQATDATSCTATVADAGGSGASAPTGTVTFSSSGQGAFGGSGTCTLSTSGAGLAGCALLYTPSSVGSGTHMITAAYAGDAAHSAVSATTQITVTATVVPRTPAGVVLGVVCSPGVLNVHLQTTCTATATSTTGSGQPPSGQVTLNSQTGQFADGGHCQLAPITTATAACSLLFTATATGTLTITASLGSSTPLASTTVASPPAAGHSAGVTVTGGTVLIKVGNTFVPLAGGTMSVPTGATINARKGRITLTTAADGLPATDPAHRVSTATISAGIFTIEQRAAQHSTTQQAPTDLLLDTPPGAIAAAHCTRAGPPRKGVVRMLQGVVKGVYRVHAAASTTSIDRGAFTIEDRCDGTLTKITKGRARVKITKGRRRNREVTLTQGQNLLVQVEQFTAKQITTRHHATLTADTVSPRPTSLASWFATLAFPILKQHPAPTPLHTASLETRGSVP